MCRKDASAAYDIPGSSTYHTGAHHVLTNDDEGPYGETTLLAETPEEDLCHGLRAVDDRVQVRAHAESEGNVDRCEDRVHKNVGDGIDTDGCGTYPSLGCRRC